MDIKPKPLLIAAGAIVFLFLLSVGAALLEYRTNAVAVTIGDWLLDTNALRPEAGGVWEQIQARERTEAGLNDVDVVDMPKQGLPDVVRSNRFGHRRAPEEGPVGYAVVWKAPAEAPPDARPIHEVLRGYRSYRIGLQVLQAARLPDARFRQVALREAARLAAPLSPTASDSTADALLEELARDVTDRLREREAARLLEVYRHGEVLQVELQQALGEYAGSITFTDDRPSVRFTIDADVVQTVFALPTP